MGHSARGGGHWHSRLTPALLLIAAWGCGRLTNGYYSGPTDDPLPSPTPAATHITPPDTSQNTNTNANQPATASKTVRMQVGTGRDPNYSAGPNSKYNAVADFDGDGQLDVAVTDNVLNHVRLYSSPGLNANVAPLTIPLTNGPRHVTAVDLNHDSLSDLVVATDQNLVVLLNGGRGNFNSPATYPLGSPGGFRAAAADFNGDTYPDLVVAGMNDTLAIFQNNGRGLLTPDPNLPMTTAGRADVNAADITGDGKPDIVAVTINPVAMNVFVNAGDGTFGAPTTYNFDTSGHTITLFDADADGYLDAVVANETQTVTLAFNDGNGHFARYDTYTFDSSVWPDDVTFADFNGDHLPDMAIATWDGHNITVFGNLGGGKFGSATHFLTPDRNWQIQAADFNNDGWLDIVSCSETYNLTLLLNTTAQ